MQKAVKSILLCGGKINFLALPVRSTTSNSMIPVNGKPVIGWILEDLIEKGLREVIVVHRDDDQHLKQFLERSFSSRVNLQLLPLKKSPSILHSLEAGLIKAGVDDPVNIILGDTLLKDRFDFSEDMVYTSEVEDSQRWCIVKLDENKRVEEYYDKEPELDIPLNALCGFYHFRDAGYLLRKVNESIAAGKKQLSDTLALYGKKYPIKAVPAGKWYDFGNIENLLEAKRQLLQSRYFNSLSVHPVLNTITKESEFDEKLRNELGWYELLPSDISVLAPRILHKTERNGKLIFTQEYYGYPTLSELYLYSDLNVEDWHAIFRKLFQIQAEFKRYPLELDAADLQEIYLDKTFDRIESLSRQNPYWEEKLAMEEVIINGEKYAGFSVLKDKISERAREISSHTQGCIIHGDLCFSNILYDVNSQIVKLIDPRGSFGRKGIYGDPRYDLAKLRHSISGLYDYIVSDLFDVEVDGAEIRCSVHSLEMPEKVTRDFDDQLAAQGYNVDDIRFIEGLLFISMLPLHQDKPKRQEMMFVNGIRLLNKVLLKK